MDGCCSLHSRKFPTEEKSLIFVLFFKLDIFLISFLLGVIFFRTTDGAPEYLACHRGAKSLNPNSNHLTKKSNYPQPSHLVSHIGASRHHTGIRTRLLLRKNPHMETARSRTPDLPT